MRLLAIMLMLLAGAASADKPRLSEWDCTVEIREGDDTWLASDSVVYWSRYPSYERSFGVIVTIPTSALSDALRRNGAFDPALRATALVSPSAVRAKKPLWARLAVGDRSLGPFRVGKEHGRYSSAEIPLADVELLLAAGPDLIAVFQLSNGTVFERTAIPTAQFRRAVGRMPAVVAAYEHKLAAPEERCVPRYPEIVI